MPETLLLEPPVGSCCYFSRGIGLGHLYEAGADAAKAVGNGTIAAAKAVGDAAGAVADRAGEKAKQGYEAGAEAVDYAATKTRDGLAYGAGAVVGGAQEVGGAVKDGAVAVGEAVGMSFFLFGRPKEDKLLLFLIRWHGFLCL